MNPQTYKRLVLRQSKHIIMVSIELRVITFIAKVMATVILHELIGRTILLANIARYNR